MNLTYTILVLTLFWISARYMLPESVQPYKICVRLWFQILRVTYCVSIVLIYTLNGSSILKKQASLNVVVLSVNFILIIFIQVL